MNQTPRHSLIESITNTAVGFGVALGSQLIIFPLFGVNLPLSANFKIGLWFTLISILRGYVLRRIFTRRTA